MIRTGTGALLAAPARRSRRPAARRASGPDAVAFEKLACDDHLLDLARSLPDEQEGSVAVEALDGELRRVPVAPVDPQGVEAHLVAHLRGEELGHPRFQIAPLPGVLPLGAVHHHQAARLELRGHLGELELDGLVLCDGLAEAAAL